MNLDWLSLGPIDYTVIQHNMMVSRLYSFTIEGGKNITLVSDDPEFTKLVQCLGASIRVFINLYKEDFALTQPMVIIKPDGTIGCKIGIIEKERYEKLLNKESGDSK